MRLLCLDIENSYLLAGVWSLWDNGGINLDRLMDNGKVMCYAAKWVGERDILFGRCDDRDFLDKLHALLDEADAVITYNGARHDIPMINREFIRNGYTPPSPYKQIDLFKTVKKQFKFPSNKLQHVCSELEIGAKAGHDGFKTWIECLKGEETAWAKMKRYNIHDVRLTERLYKMVKPWIENHPNHNLYGKTGVCTVCGSKHIQKRGKYKTSTAVYTRIHCQRCGAWSRTRYTEVDKGTREHIYTGLALN